MNIAVILAAGKGERLKSATCPKQFLKIGNKSILEHTVDKFLTFPDIEKVLVVVNAQWISHTKELFSDDFYASKILICKGGKNRQESLFFGCLEINSLFPEEQKITIISHDAARPFVSSRIISENIRSMNLGNFDALDTVCPATDTIIESLNHMNITTIPNRDYLYQGQTPQTFKLKDYISAYEKFGQLHGTTDAASLLLKDGKKVGLIEGDPFNIKITTDYDLSFAKFLICQK
ncbi:IspD/TarI family cytidylyltransferase [Parabacteroides johnsonii]|jgi:2-C-methyl-D-erythritol 4-phosphate cytidylyltransferase|uniref:IspD/TarI family cytidylyltransferase n=1 Tax=Parabacteroides johnsonii TaxID=387661 RepID=UPI00307E3351